MYIRNTYEGSEDYTEVIRSETGTTRLWFINLDVLCLWKDTFAPWGKLEECIMFPIAISEEV